MRCPTPEDRTAAFEQAKRDAAVDLKQAHDVFKRWLGDDYDLDALDAMLAAAAVERLDGDPLWLLIISGSGNAKTETVQALSPSYACPAPVSPGNSGYRSRIRPC
jgi:hypothetical protein